MTPQKTPQDIYNDLRKEFSEDELQIFIGGYQGFKKYVIDTGSLQEFYSSLYAPAEDWQRDC